MQLKTAEACRQGAEITTYTDQLDLLKDYNFVEEKVLSWRN